MKWQGSALLCAFVTIGMPPLAAAQVRAAPEPQGSLTLAEVLDAANATHPELEVADRNVEGASGKRLAAQGGWDPNLALRTRWAPVGAYNNGQVDTLVRQATPLWGIGVYAGYRIGWGNYAVYKGDLQTLSGGEVRAGVDIPLWKDGPIDARRANIQRSKILSEGAQCDRTATQLRLGREAARAYWRWVATGQEVGIQKELLEVAQRRADALTELAAEGSIPAIVVVDNERLVLDRRAKLVAAEQEFQTAALKLSLFLRNTERQPIRASADRVPRSIADVDSTDAIDEALAVQEAMARRPEVCAMVNDRAAAQVSARLAKNQLAPAVNAQAFAARDFGAGPPELGPTEFGVGVVVEVPLGLRQARGNLRTAKAEVSAVDARLRDLRDKISAEVGQARVDLRAAELQVDVAKLQVEAARKLADAERDRFAEGASDLVIVNLRELAAADAARLEVEARAAHQSARADYLTATGRGF